MRIPVQLWFMEPVLDYVPTLGKNGRRPDHAEQRVGDYPQSGKSKQMHVISLVIAAAAISYGAIGPAHAASPASAGRMSPEGHASAKTAGLVPVGGYRDHWHRPGIVLRFGFQQGYAHPWQYRAPYRRPWGYAPGYHAHWRAHHVCRRLYYAGFVRGIRYYRHLYYRRCGF